ncbi:AhpC/TSA family protein [Cryptosporidium serpentis]
MHRLNKFIKSSRSVNIINILPFRRYICSIIGRVAPDFTAKCVMPNNDIKEVTLSSYFDNNQVNKESFSNKKRIENIQNGKFVCLLFYPLNFTFVCPTEIISFSRASQKFEERNTQVLGISVDSEYSHLAWKNIKPSQGGIGNISFPLISDIDKTISKRYGVLFKNSISLRGIFIIDNNGIIRSTIINDLPIGRNVEEVIRLIDAIRHHQKYGEVCPEGWQIGKPAFIAQVSCLYT